MSHLFLIDKDKNYSYDQLLNDLNKKTTYSTYVYVKDNRPYEIFLNMIHSLVYDYKIEILDGDFSNEELSALGINEDSLHEKIKLTSHIPIATKEEVIHKMKAVQNWRLTLYTSGTTGRPKKVSHTFGNITRNVKTGHRYEDDVWAFAYNPTHMAGLQVFFQALLNGNLLVYMFDHLFEDIADWLKRYSITSISATPTFYRNLIPYLKDAIYRGVQVVTLGGERYDSALETSLKNAFPNAKLRNIYAATETGSLFTSDGEAFKIHDSIKGLVKFSEANELLIHESLLGNSDSFQLKNGWHYTGDIVEIIDETNFKFTSRQSDMINIGGYKVNPLEVENVLKEIPEIKDIVVKSRKNSVTGEIIVADVVKEKEVDGKELKKMIKKYASTHLQQWKIPRIIKFVNEIQVTRTGKKVRK